MPGVECWDESRDARLYSGPHPVDGGCFKAALASVRAHGGVLEHPAFSDAWPTFGIPEPQGVGWQRTLAGEYVCQLSQAAYGHRARKLTWLLYVGQRPPDPCDWSKPAFTAVISGCGNRCSTEARVWSKEARCTPPAFSEFLVNLARRSRDTT